MFKGLEIEKNPAFEEHLNKYDVIYLNMQQFLIEAKNREMTEYLEEKVLEEVREEYGEFLKRQVTGLADALRRIYVKTRKEFIILINEWDCIMREQQSKEMQKQYLDFLCNLLKDQDYVALAYITGILRIKECGVTSAMNMFTEYSMTAQKDRRRGLWEYI